MLKKRYEMLLLRTIHDGTPIPSEADEQTREELVPRFGGLTMLPSTTRGIWIHDGVRYEDEAIRYIVDVEDLPENRQYFVDWKPVLRARFQQLEIYITSTPVDVI